MKVRSAVSLPERTRAALCPCRPAMAAARCRAVTSAPHCSPMAPSTSLEPAQTAFTRRVGGFCGFRSRENFGGFGGRAKCRGDRSNCMARLASVSALAAVSIRTVNTLCMPLSSPERRGYRPPQPGGDPCRARGVLAEGAPGEDAPLGGCPHRRPEPGGRSRKPSRPPRTNAAWTSTKSAATGADTGTSPWPCSPTPYSLPPPPAGARGAAETVPAPWHRSPWQKSGGSWQLALPRTRTSGTPATH